MTNKKNNTPVAQGEPGVKSKTEKPTLDQGADQGTEQGADQGADQGTDQGIDQGADQGTDQGADQGAEQGAENIIVNNAEVIDPEIFEFNGVNYKLVPFVEKLQVDGKVYLRKQLLTNNEIMTSLIVGKSPFVKKA